MGNPMMLNRGLGTEPLMKSKNRPLASPPSDLGDVGEEYLFTSKNMRDELRELIFSDKTEEAMKLAQSLSDTSTQESITELLLTLEDDYDYYDEMNAIMHFIEQANPRIADEVVVSNLEQLNSQAPKWCETIIRRNLNAVGGINPDYNAFDFIELSKSTPSAYSIIRSIGNALLEQGLVPEVIRGRL